MDLILEYTLSAAAVAKGFSAYLAALFGFPLAAIRLTGGPFSLDPVACVAVLALSVVLARSMVRTRGLFHARWW